MIDIQIHDEQPGLTLCRIGFAFNKHTLFKGLDWELAEGNNVAIMGSSGAGKSTLLRIAAGLIPPHQGQVLHAGHPLSRLSPSRRVEKKIRTGFVFQEGGLFSNLDAYSNVSLPLYYHREVLELSEQDITQRSEEVLTMAQVDEQHWKRLPAHLSYGDRKRLALARALSMRPNFFFFDDPDIGMDQRTANVTYKVLSDLRDDPEVTLVIATNRNKLLQRLDISGLLLQGGELKATSGQTFAPSGWSLPPKIILPQTGES